MLAPLAQVPPHTIRPFNGPETTIQTMVRHVLGPRGERSVLVRQLTEHVVREIQPKDYLSEILAIRNFIAERARYANDPLTIEYVKDPERIAEEIIRYGKSVLDCDEMAQMIATMARQVGREADFVTVGFGAPNQFSHVFARVKEPKSGRWIITDTVAGTDEASMLRRVRTYRIWKID